MVQPVAPDGGRDEDDHENELGAKALIVGTDDPALRQAAKLVGYLPVFQRRRGEGARVLQCRSSRTSCFSTRRRLTRAASRGDGADHLGRAGGPAQVVLRPGGR